LPNIHVPVAVSGPELTINHDYLALRHHNLPIQYDKISSFCKSVLQVCPDSIQDYVIKTERGEQVVTEDGNGDSRRNFLIGATGVVGAVGVVGAAVPFVASWNPSAKARAAGASIKVDVSSLQPGEILGPFPEWRGQPIFVLRRTEETLQNLAKLNDQLADPASERQSQQPDYAQNEHRSRNPEFLIIVGICTHLGCSPKVRMAAKPEPFDENWLGGFFCPCHGSRFDLAGRVFSGVPAPSNLLVPPHYYESDGVIVIGEEETS
jgi:ubiquinol-cytochrome c reductase iron-sulfur subunit